MACIKTKAECPWLTPAKATHTGGTGDLIVSQAGRSPALEDTSLGETIACLLACVCNMSWWLRK